MKESPPQAMQPEIRTITASETYPVRLAYLRQGLPPEAAIFPGDEVDSSVHFGASHDGVLHGIVSLYRAPFPEEASNDDDAPASFPLEKSWQLRGMATTAEARGRGFGAALVKRCILHVTQSGGGLLWCNARTPAVGFYKKHGLHPVGAEFDIPTAGPHFRMWIAVSGD